MQAQTQFEWRDDSGSVRSLSDLQEILRKHRQWIESVKKAGVPADLIDPSLQHANLSGANLSGADLSDVSLFYANLSGADLSGAYLIGANLSGGARLSGADLTRAHLSGVRFDAVRVDGTVFEPQSLPEVRGIAAAKNLELLTYTKSPDALFQLRKQFEDGGFREQERKITYALKRREAELLWVGTSRKLPDENATRPILSSSDSILANLASFTLNKAFFDWTCQYGMSPGRPLLLGVVLWFLCSLVYFVCIHTPGEAGLSQSTSTITSSSDRKRNCRRRQIERQCRLP